VFSQLVNSAEFAEMIQEDARSVVDRQDMDSIPLVDDIRYHITTNVQTYSAIEEANQKLQVLEQLLVSIGLEC
jgi:ankyrin repeat/BTB/POZ domain-containing protein 1